MYAYFRLSCSYSLCHFFNKKKGKVEWKKQVLSNLKEKLNINILLFCIIVCANSSINGTHGITLILRLYLSRTTLTRREHSLFLLF